MVATLAQPLQPSATALRVTESSRTRRPPGSTENRSTPVTVVVFVHPGSGLAAPAVAVAVHSIREVARAGPARSTVRVPDSTSTRAWAASAGHSDTPIRSSLVTGQLSCCGTSSSSPSTVRLDGILLGESKAMASGPELHPPAPPVTPARSGPPPSARQSSSAAVAGSSAAPGLIAGS